MRLGDLDDLKVHISELLLVYSGADLATAILNAIDNAPTVKVTDYDTGYQDGLEDGLNDIRPQGEWKPDKVEGYDYVDVFVCSKCSGIYEIKYKYCPCCGADMRKGGAE